MMRAEKFGASCTLCILVACGGGVDDPNMLRPTFGPVARVSVVPGTLSLARFGYGALSAIVRDTAGYVLIGRPVTWSVGDSLIVRVSYRGELSPMMAGTTTVTATSEGVSGSATVTVPVAQPVATVRIVPDSLALEVGRAFQMNAMVLDAAGAFTSPSQPTVWSSSDNTRAFVSTSGVVNTVNVGTVTISVSNSGRSASAPVRIFPTLPVGALVVSPDTLTIAVGNSRQYTVVVKDTAGNRLSTRPVSWATSNPSLALARSQVYTDAQVIALNVGTVTVIASSGDKQGTATLTIVPAATAATFTVTPASATLVVGYQLRLVAIARDANNNQIYVPTTWSISDSSKAVLNGAIVTGVAPGTVTITATAGDTTAQATITVKTAEPLPLASVSAGRASACGIGTAGAVYCWGLDHYGARGDGTVSDTLAHPLPGVVSGGRAFTSVSVGQDHVCGLVSGVAYCWGANMYGQLGVGPAAPTCPYYGNSAQCSNVPLAVSIPSPVRQISVGDRSTCAVTSANLTYCWGDNSLGQLGVGSVTSIPAPASPSTGGVPFVSITVGRTHACALSTDGRAYCWGMDHFGQLGAPVKTTCTDIFGRTWPCSSVPLAVSGDWTFTAISACGDHTCALTAAGAAYCWGSNANGELGLGTLATTLAPARVSGGIAFASLSAGDGTTCGVTSSGAAYCWGTNFGQFGSTSTGSPSTTPTLVAGGVSFVNISAGQSLVCGVATSQRAYCWGYNWLGQLGVGNPAPSPFPQVPVTSPH